MFRVALTSTADRVEALGDTARRHGLEPVPLPCIEVAGAPEDELSEARAMARDADWVIVTSSRAVETLWPQGGMPASPVAAVGRATAEAVRRAGGRVEVVGDAGARGLVEYMKDRLAGEDVFFPHASGADPTTLQLLADAGVTAISRPVYETRPIAPGLDPVDAAVFASPSAVTGWCLSRTLDNLAVAPIGQTTADAIAARGHRPAVVAPHPDFDLLISLLAEFLRERSPV